MMQIDLAEYYPKDYHPELLETWPVESDLVVPEEMLPEQLKKSMGEACRNKKENLKALEEQENTPND